MYELDCPICLNSFAFEHIRSLPCGHTYCSSCTDKLTNEASTCAECREEFESDEVRRIFIKPSASNNSSGSQTISTRESPGDQEGFIRQAKHIARRVGKMNANTRAQSVKIAADVIEPVATIQCREAQEIIWKAVREFWLRLVKDFENLNVHEGLKKKLSDLERTCSKNQLQNEDLARQVQRCTRMLEDKTQEIVRLTEALRNAESEAWEAEQESQRHRQRAARLRASDTKHRVEIKRLKAGAATRRLQLEEESLIIEPEAFNEEAYNEVRSHRLQIYDENSPHPKRRKLFPEVSASADGSDNDCPSKIASSPPGMHEPRERTGPTHKPARPESDLAQSSPQRPKFGSDWYISRERNRKLTAKSNTASLPFSLDAQGKPKGLLEYGKRVRMKKAG